MNKQEIRDTLDQHQEHFRVLPTNAMNALTTLMAQLEADIEADIEAAKPLPLLDIKEPKRDLGQRTKKVAKKSKRSKR